MSQVSIEVDTLVDMCDAVREKKGTTERIPINILAKEIRNIQGGGEASSTYLNQTKTVSLIPTEVDETSVMADGIMTKVSDDIIWSVEKMAGFITTIDPVSGEFGSIPVADGSEEAPPAVQYGDVIIIPLLDYLPYVASATKDGAILARDDGEAIATFPEAGIYIINFWLLFGGSAEEAPIFQYTYMGETVPMTGTFTSMPMVINENGIIDLQEAYDAKQLVSSVITNVPVGIFPNGTIEECTITGNVSIAEGDFVKVWTGDWFKAFTSLSSGVNTGIVSMAGDRLLSFDVAEENVGIVSWIIENDNMVKCATIVPEITSDISNRTLTKLNDHKALVSWYDSYAMFYIIDIDDEGNITIGPTQTTTLTKANKITILSENKIIVCADKNIHILNIDENNNISVGGSYTAGSSYSNLCVVALNQNQLLHFYSLSTNSKPSYLYARILTVNGNTISATGTQTTLSTENTTYFSFNVGAVVINENKVLLCYPKSSSNNFVSSVLTINDNTITQSGTVALGTVVRMNYGYGKNGVLLNDHQAFFNLEDKLFLVGIDDAQSAPILLSAATVSMAHAGDLMAIYTAIEKISDDSILYCGYYDNDWDDDAVEFVRYRIVDNTIVDPTIDGKIGPFAKKSSNASEVSGIAKDSGNVDDVIRVYMP